MAYYYTPFRNSYSMERIGDICPFCDLQTIERQAVKNGAGAIVQNEHFVWLVNFFPKFEGHTMIVPKRHLVSLYDETPEEAVSRNEILKIAAAATQKLYPGSGIEFFFQTGANSKSSIKHLHWHLTPSLPSDPLRSFEKLGHFYTTKEGEEKTIVFPIKIEKAKEALQDALSKII